MVLYGCAAADGDERCRSSAFAGFDFEWAQVGWGDPYVESVSALRLLPLHV